MKTKLSIAITALLLTVLQAVSYAQSNNVIKGKLVDSLTTEPLAYATIRLASQSASKIDKGALADKKGSFQFLGIKEDKYVIKIEYIGYKTKYIEVSYGQLSTSLDLGAISLVPVSQLIESITVSSAKAQVVSTLEKQVFKSEQFEIAKGGTATDVIRNIPSVTINAEGEISLRGAKGFLILINGKPTQIDAATILAQIPANTIEKIELITAPSAKYDADGKAGILNVVTQKGTAEGLSITSNWQYGLPRLESYYNLKEPRRYGADISANYRKGKWDIATAFNYLKNDIAGQRVGDANTTINQVITRFPSAGERSLQRDNYGFRASAIYTFSKTDELTAGIYIGTKHQYRRADIFYNNSKVNLQNNQLISTTNYYNPNLVYKAGSFKVYNLDYTHKFKDASQITVSGLYEDALIDGYTQNQNLKTNNWADTLQATYNTGSNPLKALRLKIDYEKRIGIGKLAVGYQYRTQNQDGIFWYFEKNGNNQAFQVNPAFSAKVEVNNRIHGVYSQYTGSIKKLDFAFGLRYENAFREFIDAKTNNNILKLNNLFPSINLLYHLQNEWNLKLGYSRRVQRSTNNELNPYPEREHSETLEQGDPRIKPEFIGVYEVGLNKDFGKTAFYWNAYAQDITDIVNRVNSVYNDTILNRIYTNAGNARLIGSEIGLTVSPFKKLKIFVGGNVYQLKIAGGLFDNAVAVNSSGLVYTINTNINYQLSKTLNAQFNLSYLSARNTAQGEDSRFYQPNFSVKKTFLDQKLALTFQWQNAALGNMEVNQQRITTFGKDFYTTTNYIQERNILLINVSYIINKTEKKTKLPVSEFGEREF
ncbi:outer membrane beta-barrel family protein [Flectobacillus rivi]|uniref:Outer membrane beta-barrel family protein n=1 Tax=Flectobacillus rivi TaxID=2984209 RepID=A0ABT6Z949_9BACT|nr:outer membrane beta-barrel family protein [Flectobacillus rivi]MDI9877654.1 outer membrane beta-barrel family protein [Flectobacillus rivi]